MAIGKIVNKIKYIYIYENDLKKKSLDDNIHFTLIDIFNNVDSIDTMIKANSFIYYLTGGTNYDSEIFHYENTDKNYLLKLMNFFKPLNKYWFQFEEDEENYNDEYFVEEYMKLDDWWVQFEELKILINERYNSIK